MNLDKKHIYALISFFVTLFVYRVWFFSGGILTQGDWYVSFPESLVDFVDFPILWSSSTSLGHVVSAVSFYPINYISGVLAQIGFGYGLIERVTYMIPIIVFSVFGSYILVFKTTKSHIGAMVGSLLYVFNSYFILGRSGHLTLMAGFAVAPLAILFFQNGIEKRNIVQILYSSLLLVLVGAFEIRSAYIVVMIYGLITVFEILIAPRYSMSEIIERIVLSSIPIAILVLSNLYWIIPILFADSSASNVILARSLFGSHYMELHKAFGVFNPFWSDSGGEIFKAQEMPLRFYMYPIVAFLGLYMMRESKKILFYGILALFGIFLSKQADVPLSSAYEWMFTTIPGFAAFREASKFYFVTALSYSVLTGAFIASLFNKSRNKVIPYVISILILFVISLNIVPLINGNIDELLVEKEPHPDYSIFQEYIGKDPSYYKVLWVPRYSRWSAFSNQHPRISLSTITQNQWASFIEDGMKGAFSRVDSILFNPYANNLFDLSGFRYIVLPVDDDFVHEQIYEYFKPQNDYVLSLRNLTYLHEVDLGLSSMHIFENYDVRPLFFVTNVQDSLESTQDFQALEYTRVNATKYHLNLDNVLNGKHITFNEGYHSGWKLVHGSPTWIDVIFGNIDEVSADHYENAVKTNSYHILDNLPNGTYTLYLDLQKFVYIGIGISIAGLLLLAITIIVYEKRK